MAKSNDISAIRLAPQKTTPRTTGLNPVKSRDKDRSSSNTTPARRTRRPYGAPEVYGMSAFAWTGSQLNTDLALVANSESSATLKIQIEAGSDQYSDALASPMFQELVRQFLREGGMKSPAIDGAPEGGMPLMLIPDALVQFALRAYCAGRFSPSRLTAGLEVGTAALKSSSSSANVNTGLKILSAIEMMANDERVIDEGEEEADFAADQQYRREFRPLLKKLEADPSLVALLPLVLSAAKIAGAA